MVEMVGMVPNWKGVCPIVGRIMASCPDGALI
jgi:hypothetical protein